MLPMFGALNSSKNGTSFEFSLMPYGRALAVGGDTSLIAPSGAFGSSVPTKLPACTVKYMRPALLKAIVCGSRAFGSGILYSAILPVFGSTFPIRPFALPEYQILPALSAMIP